MGGGSCIPDMKKRAMIECRKESPLGQKPPESSKPETCIALCQKKSCPFEAAFLNTKVSFSLLLFVPEIVEKAGIEFAALEHGIVHDLLVEWDGRLDAEHDELIESS